ncbi:ABC transporter permease [Candidatus Pelagibacter communis]|uniref:ABC transporter permease n=1 Tax=Pelagibacter ubique TaxID=198252 RepID=UPI000AEFB0A2|nr:ABC transporter permease [Candidatus Pelagibacter ubique]
MTKIIKDAKVSFILAYYEILQRYKRSIIGQFWITITTGVITFGISIIFSTIFNADLKFYLVYVTMNFVIWILIRDICIESTNAFIESTYLILNNKWNLFIFTNKIVFRNLIAFSHNLLLVTVAVIYAKLSFNVFHLIMYFISIVILIIFLMSLSMIVCIISTRFRDLKMIIENSFQLIFFITPIMWTADLMKDRSYIIDYNPIAMIISLINNTIMKNNLDLVKLMYLIILTFISWILTYYLYKKKSDRVAFWL